MIFITIGPRQIAGWSRSMRNPSEISFTPNASNGWILSSTTGGAASTPIMRGMFGP